MPARSNREVRAVVVGAGVMGRFHAAALTAAGGKLAGIVDPDLDRARAAAHGAPIASALGDLAGSARAVDVVHVCTPVETHVGVVEAAFALGAHVIVEKPAAPNASETAALLDAAACHGVMLVPVHQFLFQNGVRRILAARELLGTLVRVEFEAATAGAERGDCDEDDLVADILPHPLAIFARLGTVPPADLQWLVQRPARGELRAIAAVGGATFEIVVSTRARPTRARLGVTGTRASAEVDLFHGFATFERGGLTRKWKAARPFARAGLTLTAAGGNLARRAARRETAYPGLRELVRQVYAAVATGSPCPIDAWETLTVATARDALLRNARVAP